LSSRELLNRCIGKTVCRQSASDATLHDSRGDDYFAGGSVEQEIAPRTGPLWRISPIGLRRTKRPKNLP
jgi:hypothetical protein